MERHHVWIRKGRGYREKRARMRESCGMAVAFGGSLFDYKHTETPSGLSVTHTHTHTHPHMQSTACGFLQ